MPGRAKISPMIPCSKEADIAEIKTEIRDIKLLVKGNGKPGIYDDVLEIKTTLPTLRKSIDEMGEGFEKSFSTLEGKVQQLLDKRIVDDTEKNLKLTAKQKMTAIIMGIISAAGVIVMIADMYLKNKA
jgi:hypothetical protein